MIRRVPWIVVVSILLAASLAVAAAPSERLLLENGGGIIHGGGGDPAKASRDTFVLMGPGGSGAPYVGDFENGGVVFAPSVHGWTSVDLTQRPESRWQVSEYRAVSGLRSAWCGDAAIPSCDGGDADPAGGYGNNWEEYLEFRGTVNDAGATTALTITATANIHSEPSYDRTRLSAEKAGVGFVDITSWDGEQPGISIDETVTYLPGEYLGPGADEVLLVWRFESDGGWSDVDCSYPSGGAIQLDDVTISSDNGVGSGGVVDFEDGTFGPFAPRPAQGVGDFAAIWEHLEDADPCRTNPSRQVAFIDDGVVVPGTGGTACQDWCYGPFGFTVNITGGLAGPDHHLHNAITSPAMAWPDPAHRGALLSYDLYRHEELDANSPGVFYTWQVASTSTGDPGDIDAWENRSFVQWGGPEYTRVELVLDDLLVRDRTHVQVRLAVYEVGWVWGFSGSDGTPAPYVDNVRFETYPVVGPGLVTREVDLANDGFPENGTVDMADPGALWVRFDMGQNISAPSHLRRDFGDSLAFGCIVTRQSAVLDGPPEIVYKVRRNPVFDPFRTVPLAAYEGRADCRVVTGPAGAVVPDRWYADLPDTGFLFPGDIAHYHLEATDIDTLTLAAETATLPADLTGFGDFDDPLGYDPAFVVRALPTIYDLAGSRPSGIFWYDAEAHGGREAWHQAFHEIGPEDYALFDIYSTNAAVFGVGNGLGGKATLEQLAGYNSLIYTCGDLDRHTIANGDFDADSSEDVQVLTAWLDSGGKNMLVTGDNLAADLVASGPATSAFLNDMLNVTFHAADIRPMIHGQAAPRVLPTPANPIFTSATSWIAYGSCPTLNTFDAVTATGAGERIAVFADPGGQDGGYPYAAATLADGVGAAGTSEVISLAYDFGFIRTDPAAGAKAMAPWAARTELLWNVILRWGVNWWPEVVSGAAPEIPTLTANAAPNPFNPVTTISYYAPRAGDLSLKIYNVRGELVRTLVSSTVTRGPHEVAWQGDDDRGARVASGDIFYEVRQGADVVVNKLALIK